MPRDAWFDLTPKEPEQILEAYSSGFVGAISIDLATSSYLRAQAPSFYADYPDLVGVSDELEFALPIRGCQVLIGENFCADRGESQRQGDCVGKMVRNQGMVDGCLDAMFGETTWETDEGGKGKQYCCEPIYGSRGHGGEGAVCWQLWDVVKPEGGIGFLFRGVHGEHDLSKYRADLSGPWGRRGVPTELAALSARNPALRVYKARSLAEVRDALAVGFGVGRCGSDGYSSERDSNGVSDPQGTWHHAIAVGAFTRERTFVDKYGEPLYLHYHNWGEWNRGGKSHDQPDGSWWVRERFLKRWVDQGQVAIVGAIPGKDRKLIFEKLMDRRAQLIRGGVASVDTGRVSL